MARASILVLALTTACAQAPAAAEPPGAPPPSTAPDEVTVEALGELTVTSAQKAEIDALRVEVETALASTTSARKQFTAEILAAIEAGSGQTSSLEASRLAMVDAFEAAKPTLLDAANRLHALLTPDQRDALLDAIQARTEAGKDEGGRELAKALDLSFAQKRELYRRAKAEGAALKAEGEVLRAQLEAADRAFRGEGFDAAELELATAPLIDGWTRHAVALIDSFAPVLDAGQRKLFTDAMRSKLGG